MGLLTQPAEDGAVHVEARRRGHGEGAHRLETVQIHELRGE